MGRLHLKWENITVVPDYRDEFDDTLHIYVYPSNVIIDKNRVIQGATVGGGYTAIVAVIGKIEWNF